MTRTAVAQDLSLMTKVILSSQRMADGGGKELLVEAASERSVAQNRSNLHLPQIKIKSGVPPLAHQKSSLVKFASHPQPNAHLRKRSSSPAPRKRPAK
jgi:hypothetical protein